MKWYLPITIIPGLGLLLMSTSNLMLSLNAEIMSMTSRGLMKSIVNRKLKQLKRLNYIMVYFYISVSLLVVSGLLGSVLNQFKIEDKYSIWFTTLGIFCLLIGLLNLIIYSFKAISIRQEQHQN